MCNSDCSFGRSSHIVVVGRESPYLQALLVENVEVACVVILNLVGDCATSLDCVFILQRRSLVIPSDREYSQIAVGVDNYQSLAVF